MTDILRKWNNPDDKVMFLLLNSRSASLGLNLQGACHKIVVLDMPENVSTFLQIVGRVHRIGQEFVQYIWVCCVQRTYNQWIFANATVKMLAQMAGEANVQRQTITEYDRQQMLLAAKDMMPQEAHELVQNHSDLHYRRQCEEYIRLLCGSRCSRLDWRNLNLRRLLTDPNGASIQKPAVRHISLPTGSSQQKSNAFG
jgi:hypothetical protein